MQLHIQQLNITVPNQEKPLLSIPDFQLNSGEHLAILGPSGSGKTTLLNAITGLIPVSPNQVLWDNTDIHQLSASQCDNWRFAHIGLIMQNFHLTTGLTALENVLLPYSFRHWTIPTAVKQRAYALLEKMDFLAPDRLVESLSRGEMQRVAIARALLSKPKVIIADEPTASLDQKNGQIITALLKDLATQEKCSLLVATHDLRLADSLALRIYLQDGQIQYKDD
ncbi:ABC transporter ATP-binding protein [Conservatibacter flavescens]|nr:ATP-binding cassette domain-containing protein [Conservatibacter flavescens]